MKLYKIQDREAGNVIDYRLPHPEALARVAEYEEADRENGDYTKDFYEIVEDEDATIYDIAEIEGLQTCNTTAASNGYPTSLQDALTGFENWEQAEQIAKVYDLQLIWLQKRNGWNLWHRSNTATHPLDITEDSYGDDYRFYKNVQEVLEDEQETIIMLIEDEVKEHVITHTLKRYAEIIEEVAKLEKGQVVVAHCGRYHSTTELHPIAHHFDSESTILAAI